MVRKLKMTVVVGRSAGATVTPTSGLTSGTCASACVMVLAGGTTRLFVSGSRVGVHRSHMGPEVRDPTTGAVVSGKVEHDDVRSAYDRYFRQMGIGVGLTALIDRTPSESMHWLTTQEMAKFRLARDSSTLR